MNKQDKLVNEIWNIISDKNIPPAPLPCPFCGKTNIRERQFSASHFMVECNDVDCLYSGVRVVVQGVSRESATEAWNRRVSVERTPTDTQRVTRVEVIDSRGRVYSTRECRVELSYQDDGRTLKVFVIDAASSSGEGR